MFYQDRPRTNIVYGRIHSTPHTKKRYVAGFWAQDDEESMDEEGLEAGAAAEKRLSLIFELEMHTF